MGPLVVLFIWAILFCIISLPLGLIGIIIAIIYSHHKNVEVKKTAWFFAPTVLLFSFAGLFFVEDIVYSIITDSGIGDYRCVNINKKYHLFWIDVPDWRIETRDDSYSGLCEVETFNHIQEILEHDDTIAFTSKIDDQYVLTQLNANKVEYAVIDSASTTDVLWNKYTKTRGIDRNKVYTCDEHYWRSRKYFYICALIFNIVLFIYIFRRFKEFWKSLLIEDF